MNIKPIETRYAGCRFRSRLEARYAVLFDKLGIRWEYEPQGFMVDRRPYLPDFRFVDSGTWVEVKGSEEELDHDLIFNAAFHLPEAAARFPTLLLLGPIPETKGDRCNWCWVGLSPEELPDEGRHPWDAYWSLAPAGFPGHPLRVADTSGATPVPFGYEGWLEPGGDMDTTDSESAKQLEAYRAARSARFEHGESP
ncbi:hypothetical protein OG884_18510 [Streptosporangium sp. NBC_01755]|uniref:hypothetical protein n=1 Tax=Streptosporangium sp. NBC_01755 TaxID=2975949 RepID=UPI002DDA01F8|nr:hypothetical protein [Streptosporangium sp. NBC_01755]WSD03800.1 hypothetical protein OG884_18510 [Streptosporangium sp. NBC_01755]